MVGAEVDPGRLHLESEHSNCRDPGSHMPPQASPEARLGDSWLVVKIQRKAEHGLQAEITVNCRHHCLVSSGDGAFHRSRDLFPVVLEGMAAVVVLLWDLYSHHVQLRPSFWSLVLKRASVGTRAVSPRSTFPGQVVQRL